MDVITRMVTTGTCRLLWNGEVTEVITSSKGLRQRDPLSPYLFCFVYGAAGAVVDEEGRRRQTKGDESFKTGAAVEPSIFC